MTIIIDARIKIEMTQEQVINYVPEYLNIRNIYRKAPFGEPFAV